MKPEAPSSPSPNSRARALSLFSGLRTSLSWGIPNPASSNSSAGVDLRSPEHKRSHKATRQEGGNAQHVVPPMRNGEEEKMRSSDGGHRPSPSLISTRRSASVSGGLGQEEPESPTTNSNNKRIKKWSLSVVTAAASPIMGSFASKRTFSRRGSEPNSPASAPPLSPLIVSSGDNSSSRIFYGLRSAASNDSVGNSPLGTPRGEDRGPGGGENKLFLPRTPEEALAYRDILIQQRAERIARRFLEKIESPEREAARRLQVVDANV